MAIILSDHGYIEMIAAGLILESHSAMTISTVMNRMIKIYIMLRDREITYELTLREFKIYKYRLCIKIHPLWINKSLGN